MCRIEDRTHPPQAQATHPLYIESWKTYSVIVVYKTNHESFRRKICWREKWKTRTKFAAGVTTAIWLAYPGRNVQEMLDPPLHINNPELLTGYSVPKMDIRKENLPLWLSVSEFWKGPLQELKGLSIIAFWDFAMSNKQKDIRRLLRNDDPPRHIANLELPTGYPVPRMDIRKKVYHRQLCQHLSFERGHRENWRISAY